MASIARFFLASSPVRMPARRSASMLICLPGIASSVKRAPTSATRSDPLEITMNWTTVMIRNTTMPTTRLPPTTSSPKVSITWPASACSRMALVEAMFSDSRNSVVNSSSEGKDDSATAFGMNSVVISSSTLMAMFSASRLSMAGVGSGSTISDTIATTIMAIAKSLPMAPRCARRADGALIARLRREPCRRPGPGPLAA